MSVPRDSHDREPPAIRSAALVVAELHAAGVSRWVHAPGSRNAPLAYALAQAEADGRVEPAVRLDERSAGFMALGSGYAGHPAAVSVTSGTAAANLYPAILEASYSRRPLIVVTADRPPELHRVRASQTAEQRDLFGSSVRYRATLPVADDTEGWAQRWSDEIRRAVTAAYGTALAPAGPVHLNVPFRDPLVPPIGHTLTPPLVSSQPPVPVDRGNGIALVPVDLDRRTVVVAGCDAGASASMFAEAAGVPLFAEPSSGARDSKNAIGPYRPLLSVPELSQPIEQVILFGNPTLSRPIRSLLAREDLAVIVVQPEPGPWFDAGAPQLTRVRAVRPTGQGDREWLRRWDNAAIRLSAALEDSWANRDLAGPGLAAEVARSAAALNVPLICAASNSIRDLDLAGPTGAAAPLVYSNRGLAGIDGTLATAQGVSWALREPATVLVGDLALLHDAGSLLRLSAEADEPLRIVVANDHGGGLFSTLEHGEPSRNSELFERFFATPAVANLEALAGAYGVSYRAVDSRHSVREILAQPIQMTEIIEASLGRSRRREQERYLLRAAREVARPGNS